MLQAQGRYFTRRAGIVDLARPIWARAEHLQPRTRRSAAQRAGLLFEEKVVEKLKSTEPGFISHLPFRFFSSLDAGYAIPDGIIFNGVYLTLVEIKLRHTVDAWYQLKDFYLPIVQCAFPWAQISCWEICKNYDPGVKLPGDFSLTSSKPKTSCASMHQDSKNAGRCPNSFNIWIWGRGK